MLQHELYMQRCLDLAQNGAGYVSPNPLVGCVITHGDKIIGEGWHRKFGEAHAEVNAIRSVENKALLKTSTLYVNLEPCSHHGKTPPCAELIVESGIPRVVMGMKDPYHEVAGTGIARLQKAGIDVTVGVLEEQCHWLNRRFIHFVTQKKPYVFLKWAQTQDGFIAPDASKLTQQQFEEKRHITGFIVQKLVHRWRTEEDAILVGTRTAITDNPALNTRAWNGRNPVRITMDKNLRIPLTAKLYDGSQPTVVFTDKKTPIAANALVTYRIIDFSKNIWPQILTDLYEQGIQSLIVEGGLHTLQSIINSHCWNEIQRFTTPATLLEGIAAPAFHGRLVSESSIDKSTLTVYINA
ncbi:MAG: bifunctional diaminohydroxyphosphoribosylaminopyrimidine deaminase/5-amino-6-(5-phosphoribosylamino)uracil reductase RibD [Bacteroidota bacterium]